MKGKLLGTVFVIIAAVVLVFVALGEGETKAQEGGEEETCPPERCYSMETPEEESIAEADGTCTCGIFFNSYCHYETVPAFACVPEWHEEDNSSSKDWNSSVINGSWGLKKYYSSSPQLELLCPIPADSGASSIKHYANVAQVIGYFYHYNSSYTSRMEIFTATPFGSATSLSKGYINDSGSNQRSLYVYPTSTKHEHWYAKIYIASHYYNSFHGLRICYDPD